MLRLALKSVRHNPKRLILTAVAVVLGVSLVATTQVITNALSTGFQSLFNEVYATVDVVVNDGSDPLQPSATLDHPIGTELLEEIRALPEIADAAGGVGYDRGVLLNQAGDGAHNATGAPTLIFNWTGVEAIDRSTIIDGREPQGPGEAVLDIDSARSFEVGQTISFSTEVGVRDFTLVGTFRFGENNSTQTAILVYMVEEEVREVAGGATGYQIVEAVAAEGVSAEAARDAVAAVVPEDLVAKTGAEAEAEQVEAFAEILQYIDIFTLAFAIIAIFVGGYLIANTFRTIVTQRTREFGLLRALGVSGKQVQRMVVLEATIVGVVASTIALLLGWLLAVIIVAIVEATVTGEMFGSTTLPPKAIAWSYALGITVTLVSAILPAFHASRISPMEALRESATQAKKGMKQRTIVGGAMSVIGIVAVGVGLITNVPNAYVFVGAGAIILILGVTLLAAWMVVPIARSLRSRVVARRSVSGRLAVENIRREPRRSANAAAALMIGVMLLALVATFTESIKSTVTEQFQTSSADLMIMANQTLIPQGAVDVVADTDGIAQVARIAVASATIDGDNRSLGVVDPAETSALFEIPSDRPFTEMGDGIFVDLSMVNAGVNVGDVMTITGDRGTRDVEVTGVLEVHNDTSVMMSFETASQLVSDPFIVQVLIGFEDGVDPEATRTAVEERLAETYPLIEVSTAEELAQFLNQAIDMILGFISALLASALVIAILGVANTLLLSVTERTREIGLLRAVGLRRRQVRSMIRIESMILAVFGTILGVILGVALGVALVESLGEFGFSGATVPWGWLVLYMVLAALAGLLAAVWPARRASKLDILEAIATD